MTTFGLSCEGPTDRVVIENILTGYFRSPDIEFHPLPSVRDNTDQYRTKNFGGWHKVFEYCESEQFKQAMVYNDYLIVHIDTDVCECWLLPLFYNDNKKFKTDSYLKHLKRGVNKKEKFGKIDLAKKKPRDYVKLSKPYQKYKILIEHYEENPSLKIFIENIKGKNIQIEDDDL